MKYQIEMAEQVLDGKELSEDDGLKILNATGSELTAYFAGAQWLREQTHQQRIHLCTIVNAKSGRCEENCSFCAQSIHHNTGAPEYALKTKKEILAAAHEAEARGNACFSIVTSGTRIQPGREAEQIEDILRAIRAETALFPSASLGTLDLDSAQRLRDAGCVTYHHNLETARSFYGNVCTTHSYDEDIATVVNAKKAGLRVCCGGILGLGESLEQRFELGLTLRELDVDSVPINFLTPIDGTPLEGMDQLTPQDCLRIICLYRYLLPAKTITICGGRGRNLRDFQSCIFMAGANGMMVGNYLTTSGRNFVDDTQMLSDAEVVVDAASYTGARGKRGA